MNSEKCLEKRVQSSKKQFKQQQQQRQIFTAYESRENLDSFSLSILPEISQTEYVRQRQKFGKEILKFGRRIVYALSNMQNVAIPRCCFVTFSKQRQRNEQRIITHAYTCSHCTRCRQSLLNKLLGWVIHSVLGSLFRPE